MQTQNTEIIILITIMLLTLGVASIYSTTSNNIPPTPTPAQKPDPKPVNIEVRVTPWGDMYRKEPDCNEDFSVELVSPNQNENFTTNTVNVVFNAGAFFWVVERLTTIAIYLLVKDW